MIYGVAIAFFGFLGLAIWAGHRALTEDSQRREIARLNLVLDGAHGRIVALLETIAQACEERDLIEERCEDLAATNRALLEYNARLVNEQGELQPPAAPPDIVGEDALAIHDMILELGAFRRSKIMEILRAAETAADTYAFAITQARERFETVGLSRPQDKL